MQFLISSKKKEPLIITEATYNLLHNDETVSSGKCEVADSKVMVLLELEEYGSYVLEVTYTIAPETRKARCLIDVY